jgi:hypothetical protein
MDLAFDGSDSLPVNRVVTISKDASIRLWDINGKCLGLELEVDIYVSNC